MEFSQLEVQFHSFLTSTLDGREWLRVSAHERPNNRSGEFSVLFCMCTFRVTEFFDREKLIVEEERLPALYNTRMPEYSDKTC